MLNVGLHRWQAADAFDGFDLSDLQDETGSFDLSRGVWREGGWQELDSLRRKLEARSPSPPALPPDSPEHNRPQLRSPTA